MFSLISDVISNFGIMTPYPEPGVSGDIMAPGASENQDQRGAGVREGVNITPIFVTIASDIKLTNAGVSSKGCFQRL